VKVKRDDRDGRLSEERMRRKSMGKRKKRKERKEGKERREELLILVSSNFFVIETMWIYVHPINFN
jgi:hypothetical protein